MSHGGRVGRMMVRLETHQAAVGGFPATVA